LEASQSRFTEKAAAISERRFSHSGLRDARVTINSTVSLRAKMSEVKLKRFEDDYLDIVIEKDKRRKK